MAFSWIPLLWIPLLALLDKLVCQTFSGNHGFPIRIRFSSNCSKLTLPEIFSNRVTDISSIPCSSTSTGPFSRRFREGNSFPNYVERSILKLPPLQDLCCALCSTEQSTFRGREQGENRRLLLGVQKLTWSGLNGVSERDF